MDNGQQQRNLAALSVRRVGRLVETGEPTAPYVLLDAVGAPVVPVSDFFRDLLAAGRPAATLRSYGLDLLRWWRFLHAVGVRWDQATRIDARDFSCWIQSAPKPRRGSALENGAQATDLSAAQPNQVTGKPAQSLGYAARTIAHSETVLRTFYDFVRDVGVSLSSLSGPGRTRWVGPTGCVCNTYEEGVDSVTTRGVMSCMPWDGPPYSERSCPCPSGKGLPVTPRPPLAALPDAWTGHTANFDAYLAPRGPVTG